MKGRGQLGGRHKGPRIIIGTSGWHYDHWRGPFYPEGLPAEGRLAFYARHFQSVEINNSFYQLPEAATVAKWRETVPEGFVFAVKASRYITHMKKLKDPLEASAAFFGRVCLLQDKLGPILFQLPPRWRANPERLRAFLAQLPRGGRYAFEFRERTWFCPEIYQVLADFGVAFCICQLSGVQSPKQVTADFVYVRLHGPGEAYRGAYDPDTLAGWAAAFSTWRGQGRDVYCYFDNDEAGYAVRNAAELGAMLAG